MTAYGTEAENLTGIHIGHLVNVTGDDKVYITQGILRGISDGGESHLLKLKIQVHGETTIKVLVRRDQSVTVHAAEQLFARAYEG